MKPYLLNGVIKSENYFVRLADATNNAFQRHLVTQQDLEAAANDLCTLGLLKSAEVENMVRGEESETGDYDDYDQILYSVLSRALYIKGCALLPTQVLWAKDRKGVLYTKASPAIDTNKNYICIGYTGEKDECELAAIHGSYWLDSRRGKVVDTSPKDAPCPPLYFYMTELWEPLCIPMFDQTDHKLCKDLSVRPSLVPGIGSGLFATKDMKKGTFLGYYAGDLLRGFQVYRRYHGRAPMYVLQLKKDLYVDASDEKVSNILRYANDAYKTKFNNNAKFAQNTGIILTKHVKAGEEIFISYGASCWRKHNTSNTTYSTKIVRSLR